jgi:hypothetical protein
LLIGDVLVEGHHQLETGFVRCFQEVSVFERTPMAELVGDVVVEQDLHA